MSDQAVLSLTQQSGDVPEAFQSKQYLFVNDSNNSSYSGGQLIFDLSSLSNSGRWINWSEATIQIPVIFGYKHSADASGVALGPLGMAWKNGWHQLVDSMEVQFGNVSVSQITPFTNIFTTFKMLTTFSQDAYYKYGALLNFFKDDHLGYSYISGGANINGQGCVNNLLIDPALVLSGAGAYPQTSNKGLLSRAYNTNLPAGSLPAWSHYTSSSLTQLGRPSFRLDGSGADRVAYTEAIATIRLKDVSDFFNKLGLCKGAFVKLTLNINSSVVGVDTTVTSGAMALTSAKVSIQGRTTPFMVSANVANSPLLAASAIAGTISFGSAISKLTFGQRTVSNSLLSSCRFYAPAYSMTAEAQQGFLDAFPTRDIFYDDIYQYTVSGVEPGAQFTQLVSNSIIAPQYLVVVPIISAGANISGQSVSPIQSPFASEPGTTSAGIALGQFNVQLSGSNLYMQNQQYTFEQFQFELSQINALNGGQTDQMSSGLIGLDEWHTCYQYYVADLSRGQPIDQFVPKSVQILGTNTSSKSTDYFTFVVYRRKITIRTIDSSIVA